MSPKRCTYTKPERGSLRLALGLRRLFGLRWASAAALILLAVAGAGQTIGQTIGQARAQTGAASAGADADYLPGAKHVFVINLENKGYDSAWGADSAAPQLSGTLRGQGVLLTQYFGVAHNSLPNYFAQISGQGPNPQTQADCQTYSPFVGTGTAPPGQFVGDGCVYPADVPTVAGRLSDTGRNWKGYQEDLGPAAPATTSTSAP